MRKQGIELTQVRQRDLYGGNASQLLDRQPAGLARFTTARSDSFGGDDSVAPTGDDRLFDAQERMFGQQLQHAGVWRAPGMRP